MAVVVALRSPLASLTVAARLSVKLASFGGVIFRLVSVQPPMSTIVLPTVAVKVCVPSVSLAPTGIALTTSEAKLFVSPVSLLTVAPRLSAMAEFSTPVTAKGVSVGASGSTVTVSVAVATVLRLPSISLTVAATLSVKLTSVADVTVRFDNTQEAMLTVVCPVVAVKLLVPSLSVAPTGIAFTTSEASELASAANPLTVTEREPKAIGDPSTPATGAAAQVTVGAKGFTITVSVAVPVDPVAVNTKFKSLTVTIDRLVRVQPSTGTDVLPAVAVKLWP